MNYDKSTNEELNGRLLELLHGEQVNHFALSDDKTFVYDCGPTGDSFYRIDLLDYCTDWNATMPLAIEHGVSVLSCDGAYEVSYDYYAPVGSFGTEELLTWHVEVDKGMVLRAIVICLIKLLESKK